MGKKTKISTFDSSWSPIVGCSHECNYCYARRIAERFAGYDMTEPKNHPFENWYYIEPNNSDEEPALYVVDEPLTRITKSGEVATAPYPFGFRPTFHRYKLDEPQKWKEPRNIFVCSMADLFGAWVPEVWIEDVFDACEKAPQHQYFFLTKNPDRYVDLYSADMLPARHNFWYGSTITKAHQSYFTGFGLNTFLSIEPIQEYLDVGLGSFESVEWIIIGAETGNRIGKVKPEKRWIENIVETAKITQTPVFMKESLRELMGEHFRQEFPW